MAEKPLRHDACASCATAERAYALLGHGRSLTALGHPGADVPLTEARELFKSMGYQPALAETGTLLEQTTAAAS